MKEHIDTITDLLLGAAYADKRLEGDELIAIKKLLTKLLGADELPREQVDRISAFNPARFNVHEAAAAMKSTTDADKRKVLDLIATVNESDEVLDLDEDAYLRKVAKGMGIADEAIKDLTIEIIDEDELDQFFEE